MAIRSTPGDRYEQTVDIRDYLDPIARHKFLVVATALLVVGLAFAYTLTRPPVYTSTATVLVKPTEVNLTDVIGSVKLINLSTEVQLVESTRVARRAAATMGNQLPIVLQKRVSAQPIQDSQTLEITFDGDTPVEARDGATAFAQAYLEERRALAQSAVQQQSVQIIERIEDAKVTLVGLEAEIAEFPRGSPLTENERAERQSTRVQIDALQIRLAEVALLNTDPGTVLVEAQLPRRPSSPNRVLHVSLGVFFGLLLGVGAGFVRGRLDQRLHKTADVEEALGVPLFAAIPAANVKRGRRELVALHAPSSIAAEAYRVLRTTLSASNQNGNGTYLIVSSAPGDGKTTVAANLAVTFAHADKDVVLVSTDLRRPRLHELFGLKNERGLADYLTQSASLDNCLVEIDDVRGLSVLPSGSPPAEPVELLASDRMRELMTELRRSADVVILDCPPLLTVADTLVLARLADGAVFVVDSSVTKRTAVIEARRRLDQVAARVLGSVLNKVPPAGHDGYGYGYGFAYGNGTPTPRRSRREEKKAKRLADEARRDRGATEAPAAPEPPAPTGEPEQEPSPAAASSGSGASAEAGSGTSQPGSASKDAEPETVSRSTQRS